MDLLHTIGHRITQGPTLGYAILILALILAPRIAEVLRLPAMVGLVLAGMALGPHGAARARHQGDRALRAGRLRPALPDVQRRPRAGPQAVHEDEAGRDHVRAALLRVPVHARHHQRQAAQLQVGGGGADGIELGIAHARHLPDASRDGAVAQPRRRHRRGRHRRDRHLRAAGPVGRVGRGQAGRKPGRAAGGDRGRPRLARDLVAARPPARRALVLRARRDRPRLPFRVRHRGVPGRRGARRGGRDRRHRGRVLRGPRAQPRRPRGEPADGPPAVHGLDAVHPDLPGLGRRAAGAEGDGRSEDAARRARVHGRGARRQGARGGRRGARPSTSPGRRSA